MLCYEDDEVSYLECLKIHNLTLVSLSKSETIPANHVRLVADKHLLSLTLNSKIGQDLSTRESKF